MVYKQLQRMDYVRGADLRDLDEKVLATLIQWVDMNNEYCAEPVGAPFEAEGGDYVQAIAMYKWITIPEPKNDR